MGWGPSAIYTVEHISGHKVEVMRISDLVFDRAEKGYTHFQTKVCLRFRDQVKEDLAGDPGFIYYDELKFTKVRNVPAAAKLPPKMKPAGPPRKRTRSGTQNSRR